MSFRLSTLLSIGATLALLLTEGASAGQIQSAQLAAVTGVPVSCYSPDEWAQIIPASNVSGMTVSTWSAGQLLTVQIQLPQWVCDDAPQAAASPTFQHVLAARIVGHEWGNANAARNAIDNTGELAAACFGQEHFWDLLDQLGLNAIPTTKIAATVRALTLASQGIAPSNGCLPAYPKPLPVVSVPAAPPRLSPLQKPKPRATVDRTTAGPRRHG